MLKTSKYNFIWPLENSERVVIFNSFNAATMEIGKHNIDLLKDGIEIDLETLKDEKKKTALELEKNGFLIEEYIDEKRILMHRNSSGRYRKDSLILTIIPTLACNLKCIYCFQDRNQVGEMALEVQEAIENYVKSSIQGIKNIHVSWFGGEPLLAWGVICSLSRKLIKIAKENGCEYSASMVSNGYLFNDEKIKTLSEIKIKNIQITLDGPPQLHSSRKGLKGNTEENFKKILDIINSLQDNNIKVSIRFNIDKTNMDSSEELLDILAESLSQVNIYPAQVAAFTQVCSNIEDGCLNNDEFLEVEKAFYSLLLKKGLQADLSRAYPKIKANFCCADQINSFTIGPDGYVYKCWNTVDNKDEMVSDIMKRETGNKDKKKMVMRHLNWLTNNPFEEEECRECKVLPLCMGGCPYKHRESKNNKSDCITAKNNLEHIILNHFYCLKIKKIFNNMDESK